MYQLWTEIDIKTEPELLQARYIDDIYTWSQSEDFFIGGLNISISICMNQVLKVTTIIQILRDNKATTSISSTTSASNKNHCREIIQTYNGIYIQRKKRYDSRGSVWCALLRT